MKFRYLVIIIGVVLLSCNKEESTYQEAEIIGFNSLKCGCCWGWIIETEQGIIKTDYLPNADLVGYSIKSPVPVLIEIGEKVNDCDFSGGNYDYYEIMDLKIR